jgi:hypothetical protein
MHTGDPSTELVGKLATVLGDFAAASLNDTNLNVITSKETEASNQLVTLNLRFPIPSEVGCTFII